jgi:hypothetical protein
MIRPEFSHHTTSFGQCEYRIGDIPESKMEHFPSFSHRQLHFVASTIFFPASPETTGPSSLSSMEWHAQAPPAHSGTLPGNPDLPEYPIDTPQNWKYIL